MNAWHLSTIIAAVLALTGANIRASMHITAEQARQWAVSTPQPKYPEAARLRRITGLGYFKLRVNRATGRVTEITVLRSTGNQLLDASAISTLRQWRFRGGGVLPSIRRSSRPRGSLSRTGISSSPFQSTINCREMGSSLRPNQSMKPTAPLRNTLSVFATTPCRGLSFSLDAFPANTRMDAVAEVAHRHYSNYAHRALRRRNLLL